MLSTFLAELAVFDMGKVEISQYYLTHHERIARIQLQLPAPRWAQQLPA